MQELRIRISVLRALRAVGKPCTFGALAAVVISFAAFAQAPVTPQPLVPAPVIQAPAASAPAASPVPAPPSTDAAPPTNSPIVSALLPRDLSPWGMFLNADVVVKIVMIGLVFASLITWTVWLAKTFELWRAKRQASEALIVLNEARTLAEANARLGKYREPVARLARTALHEAEMSANADPEGLKERISWLLERVEASSSRRIGRGMGLLASIGATAPFVGLFGTVWGIMNSFIGISNAHTTNLAVVAPGIAEALLATALGLFAAIPAVVIYNVFARSIGGYRALLADGSALVMRLVSRDCDRLPVSLSRAAE
jgi:biopolymer transport protein ExbB